MVLAHQLYVFGPFRLDPAERLLLREGEPVALTPKCFDLLVMLVENSGHLLEKQELLDRIWPGQFVEEANLSFNISSLRKALGQVQSGDRFIETVPKKGFRFVADVEKRRRDEVGIEPTVEIGKAEVTALEHEELQVPSSEARTIDAVTPKVVKGGRGFSLGRVSLLILASVVLAILIYALFTRGRHSSPQPRIASIVVLPLQNLSDNANEEYFADGMTDALIGDLAKIGELRVISRTSSMHYKGTKKSLPEIAAELKVDAVVEGTIQRSGERVRIRAQLIHAATDEHLWVQTYERDLRDVLELQSEIAQAIARQVQIKLSPAEQARLTPRRPVHPRALDAYLQGRYLFWNKRTVENLQKSIEYFQSAIREDSNYALAYAGLADCYAALGNVQFSGLPPMEARARAEEAAVKALELDSSLAEAHSALGTVKHFSWNWAAAEQEFKRAIELNPSYANAHNSYASFLMSQGRIDESLAASSRARELDPLSLSISVQRGFLLENARRYDEAIEQLNRVVALDQNHYQAHWMLGHTYAVNGQFDQAIGAAEKAVALSERAPGALGMLGMIYGLAGRKADAVRILNELLELNQRRYVTPAALAYVYIGLSDEDQAFVWLEKAYQERSNFLAYLKVVPVADPLRSDPRFADLVRRVGLPQ
jgi:TolB-like protein/DNA-binding winged helix-turn-helix (wHTH) protein/Tfp pilus assembly protein PilF